MATVRTNSLNQGGRLGPLSYCSQIQEEYEGTTSIEERKEKGQVFTPPGVCRYMAGLFSDIPQTFKLLDPGAGLGTLTAAVCERVLSLRSPRKLEAHLYETDPLVRPLLEKTMSHCRDMLHSAGHGFSFTIEPGDFIVDGPRGLSSVPSLFDSRESYDAVIMNPPYFKVGAGSLHARAMADTLKGHTNIYPLFMARAAELLRPEGEMVAITPRSFCNGLYFREFRRWFFSEVDLAHVHLFECRRSTFEDVLQESVITLTRRTRDHAPDVHITTSRGRDIPESPARLSVPRARVLREESNDVIVYIPTSELDAEILKLTDSWPDRFSEVGLGVSTGPVVLFRTEEFLRPTPNGPGTAPLIGPHNVKPFETVWPLERKNKPAAFVVSPESARHLVPTRNYVLLRRFTAKEEKRRLVASCYLKSRNVNPHLAIENHVNYVYHGSRELSDDEVFGLAALFNSALFDSYFRIMSGNTQVNATELRMMKFPKLETIAAIGERIRNLGRMQPEGIEDAVLGELGINGRIASHFTEAAL